MAPSVFPIGSWPVGKEQILQALHDPNWVESRLSDPSLFLNLLSEAKMTCDEIRSYVAEMDDLCEAGCIFSVDDLLPFAAAAV
jgi:hypothetical protein